MKSWGLRGVGRRLDRLGADPRRGGLGDPPGKVTRALGVTMDHYGCDLTRGPLTVRPGRAPRAIDVTTRIGIRKSADLKLRFVARD